MIARSSTGPVSAGAPCVLAAANSSLKGGMRSKGGGPLYSHEVTRACMTTSTSTFCLQFCRCLPTVGKRSLEPRMRVRFPSPILWRVAMSPSPCRPAARTSVFQAAERGCKSRHGCSPTDRSSRFLARTSQLVQGSPSRFISADARVRFPQLRRPFRNILPARRAAAEWLPTGPSLVRAAA